MTRETRSTCPYCGVGCELSAGAADRFAINMGHRSRFSPNHD
ncbi:MAG: hypothetical protein H0W47_11125 [Polaromonas sp.]|nr:hypothetical protein [Polaromonas sp.]